MSEAYFWQGDPTKAPVVEQVKKWLRIRGNPGDVQLCADIDHSALLNRILSGKEPLPDAPPKSFSYPWYSLVESGEDEVFDVRFYQDATLQDWAMVNQHPWKVDFQVVEEGGRRSAHLSSGPWRIVITRTGEVKAGWPIWKVVLGR